MRNSFRYTPLSAEKSCALFRQLAQLEKSGFHADKAFALIADTDKALKLRLHAIQTHIKAGKPIAEAGFKAGLFNAVQQALIHAAESGGTLATVYTRLADHYATRAQRLRKIKTQCLFPALLLIISLFLQPLPAHCPRRAFAQLHIPHNQYWPLARFE